MNKQTKEEVKQSAGQSTPVQQNHVGNIVILEQFWGDGSLNTQSGEYVCVEQTENVLYCVATSTRRYPIAAVLAFPLVGPQKWTVAQSYLDTEALDSIEFAYCAFMTLAKAGKAGVTDMQVLQCDQGVRLLSEAIEIANEREEAQLAEVDAQRQAGVEEAMAEAGLGNGFTSCTCPACQAEAAGLGEALGAIFGALKAGKLPPVKK